MRKNRKFGALLMAMAMAVSTMGGMTTLAEDKQVSSQKGSEVQFTKEVTAPEGVTLPGKTFNFTAIQMTTTDGENFTENESKTPMYGKNKAGKEIKQGEKVESITGSASIAESKLSDKENLFLGTMNLSSLQTPGVYVFKVFENTKDKLNEENYGWRNAGHEEYLMRVYVKKNGDGLSYETTFIRAETDGKTTTAVGEKLSGPTVKDGNITKKGDILFTNNFTKRAGKNVEGKKESFIIQKTIDDQSGYANLKEDKFFFKVTLTNADVNGAVNKETYKGTVYTVDEEGNYTKKNSENTENTVTVTEKEDTKVTLLANEALVFEDIPAGTEVTVEENEIKFDNYSLDTKKSTLTLNGTETMFKDVQKDTVKTLGENKNIAKFVNKYKEIEVTGLALRYMPFILIGLVAVAGALVYNKAKNLRK